MGLLNSVMSQSPPWTSRLLTSSHTLPAMIKMPNRSRIDASIPTTIVYRTLLLFIGAILLASRCSHAADSDSGLREYRLFHGPCLGSGGEEIFAGDVLVKHIGGKSRGKFQPASDANPAKACSAGGLTRSKLRDESGNEWISSFLAVGLQSCRSCRVLAQFRMTLL